MAVQSLPGLILMLAALTALAPLAIDAYLPAMSVIREALNTTPHAVELSLSLFLASFAVGQVTGGPLSDHFGRRRMIFIGIGLFVAGTLVIIASQQISWLWGGRIIQALGGGLAIVNAAAVIRDISSGRDSARYLSHMGVIIMIAPLLAPLIGMLILHASGWRAIFVFLLLYALILGLLLFRKLPETRVIYADRPNALRRYWRVISHRQALGYIASQSLTYGALFTFITASPLVYMGFFGVSETWYPFLFGINVVCIIAVNRLNVRLLRRFSPHQLLTTGQLGQCVCGLLLLGFVLLIPAHQLFNMVVVMVMLFIGFQGLIIANTIASTIELFPDNSATASALLSASGFMTGAIAGGIAGSFGETTPFPMAVIMCFCAFAGLAIRLMIQQRNV